MRRLAIAILAVLASAVLAADAGIVTRFRSPKNPDRTIRKSTEYIILHTTEAPARGSLKHLSDRGECHYCITEDGTIYQIVDRNRVAFHAGCSMWNGKEDVDNFSIGIECVGYHDKPMPKAQLASIKLLVKQLQALYKIPDHKVLTHSQVAYGIPNRWQKRNHRGRKRCGMLFAMPSVRKELGLKTRPSFDPDVKARRLAVGDKYLEKVLFGGEDTMVKTYGAGKILAVHPAAKANPAIPKTPRPAAASASFRKIPQSIAELRRQGFEPIGSVTKTNLPGRIAGSKWNAPDTYYSLRGRVTPGNMLDPRHVEEGMNVWRKKDSKAK